MRQSIVIAQVGTSSYKSTEYESVQGVKNRTGSFYSFEAVAKEALRQTNAEELQIVLFGTVDSALGSMLCEGVFSAEEAYESEVLDIERIQPNPNNPNVVYYRINNIAEEAPRRLFEEVMSERLTRHFQKEAEQYGGKQPQVKLALSIIEYGVDDQQLSHNFELIHKTVNQVVNPNAYVDFYFDISNGFRSFPIYIYTLMNYLSRIDQRKYYELSEGKKQEDQMSESKQKKGQLSETEEEQESRKVHFHLYYGMFDARSYYVNYRMQRELEDATPNVTPLVDLQAIDNLMLLINGINEFRTCGSVIQICSILESHPNWDIVIGESRNHKQAKLSDAFRLFSYGTNGNNLSALEESVRLLKEMDQVISNNTNIDIGEKLLLQDISEDFTEKFDYSESKCPYTKFMLQLAKWYLEQERNGSAAIAAQESIVTYFMERYPKQVNVYLESGAIKKYQGPYDFKNTEYLFDYDLRNPVKTIVDKNHGKKDEDKDDVAEFIRVYKKTKIEVRNIMAHISYKTDAYISTESSQPYRLKDKNEKIKKLIQMLSEEIEMIDGGQKEGPLGVYFSDRLMVAAGNLEDKEEYRKKKELLTRMLEGLEKEEEVPETAFGRLLQQKNPLVKDEYEMKLDQLKEQIIIMKKSKSFEAFYAKKDKLKLLFLVMETWVKGSRQSEADKNEKLNREDYRKCYEDKKDKQKKRTRKGYERLISYMKGSAKEMVELIESV